MNIVSVMEKAIRRIAFNKNSIVIIRFHGSMAHGITDFSMGCRRASFEVRLVLIP